jgi:hypothetical protein
MVRRRFEADVRLPDPRLAAYVSGLLVDFTHVDNLYWVRDARGRGLEDVGEMLLESNPLLEAASFDREREVRKHVGDYVLFVAGLFPESLSSRQRFRQMRLDAFVDYMKAGKESYRVVSSFDQFEYRDEAPLFRKLADNFELCVFGLNLVKDDLERLQRAYYRGLRQALDA